MGRPKRGPRKSFDGGSDDHHDADDPEDVDINMSKRVCHRLYKMYQDNDHTNFTLKFGQGDHEESIEVHSLVLCAASQWFEEKIREAGGVWVSTIPLIQFS